MSDRYPGYDVLAKRRSPSWNAKTREAIDQRLATEPERHRAFDGDAWLTLRAVCGRIIPQPTGRQPVPLAAMVDEKVFANETDGYRDWRLPAQGEAWRRGLAALQAEAQARHGRPFHRLAPAEQDGLLSAVQKGLAQQPDWGDMPPAVFFEKRLVPDIVTAYYAHPTAWNEIGFGGPAAPRGYVRMDANRRDPWEAAEAHPGRERQARHENARAGRS